LNEEYGFFLVKKVEIFETLKIRYNKANKTNYFEFLVIKFIDIHFFEGLLYSFGSAMFS
jgi:hypothetical protein